METQVVAQSISNFDAHTHTHTHVPGNCVKRAKGASADPGWGLRVYTSSSSWSMDILRVIK